MGAYYHILCPFEVSVQDDPALEQQLLDQYGGHFVLKGSQHIERFSPPLSDGSRLDFSYTEKTYALPEEVIRSEFLAFSQILFKEWYELYHSKFKKKFPAAQLEPAVLAELIAHVHALLVQHPLSDRNLKEALQHIRKNYFFSIEEIYPQVVYYGYPLETAKHTSLKALNLFIAYEKMDLYPDEYTAMFLLVDKLQEKYRDQFVMANYLFIAGY